MLSVEFASPPNSNPVKVAIPLLFDITSISFPFTSFINIPFCAFSLLVAILNFAPSNATLVSLLYLYTATAPVCTSGFSDFLVCSPEPLSYSRVAWLGIAVFIAIIFPSESFAKVVLNLISIIDSSLKDLPAINSPSINDIFNFLVFSS